MYVAEQTPQKLTLKAAVDLPATLLLNAIPLLLLLLLLTTFVFGSLSSLVCDRSAGSALVSCQLTTSGLFGRRVQQLSPGQLQGADLEFSDDSNSGRLYRVVLLTAQGRWPLTRTYTADKLEQLGQVNAINTFLQNSAFPSLTLRQDNRLTTKPVGMLFLAFPLVLLVIGTVLYQAPVYYSFDKTLNRVCLETKGLLRKSTTELQLTDIANAQLMETKDDHGIKTYEICLILTTSDRLPLEFSGSPSEFDEVVRIINHFLGVEE